MKENWKGFKVIEIRNVITSCILENKFCDFKSYLTEIHKDVDWKIIDRFEEEYNKKYNEMLDINKKLYKNESDLENQTVYDFYFQELPKFTQELKIILNKVDINTYTALYQDIDNNIRSSGNAFSKVFIPENILKLSDRTNHIIKIVRLIVSVK